MPFSQLLTDKVTLVKKNGTVVRKDIKASVQSKMIFVHDQDLPIEVGDHFLRQLPSGLVEDYIVDDPGFHARCKAFPHIFKPRYTEAIGQLRSLKRLLITSLEITPG